MEAFPVESGPTPSLAEDPALALDRRAKFEILGAIMLGLFLGALDQTIVGTALPKIVTQLGGNDLYIWVVTIYLLTSTITVPFYGKLSDLYGRKPMLMLGISLFLVGSALSGLSQTMWQLILFRGIQGLGAGALFPISLAVIGDLFTPAERGKYQGLFGAVFGIASLIGPALGGFLTDTVSWHWVFYVNLPIGLVALYVIWHLLPTVKRAGVSRDLDYLGGAVFTVAIGFLLVGLTNKQFGDWADLSVGGFIAIGLILGAVFLAIEARAKEPIVPLDLWRNRTYAAAIVSTFFVSFGFFGAIIFLPRWFQFVKGVSATESGYQALALLIGLIAASVISGQIVARTGRYKPVLLASLVIMVVGLYLMSNIKADTSLPVLWVWMFITGVGIGPTLAVYTIVVQNAVAFQKLGVATSNLTFFRQIGGSVGLAIAGTAFGSSLIDRLPTQLQANGVPAQIVSGFGQVGHDALDSLTGVGQDLGQAILSAVPGPFRAAIEPFVGQIVTSIYQAFSLSVGDVFRIGVLSSIAAVAAALAMREIPLRQTLGPQRAHAPHKGAEASPAHGLVPVDVKVSTD